MLELTGQPDPGETSGGSDLPVFDRSREKKRSQSTLETEKKRNIFLEKYGTLHMKINFVLVCLANINFRKWLSNIKLLNHPLYTVAMKNLRRMHV
jgi:hypothetical protein